MKVEMSVELWWNGTDRGKQKKLEKNQSQCHFEQHKWTDLGSRPSTRSLSSDTAFRVSAIKCYPSSERAFVF
jgi:hypothetical protein